MFRTGADSKRNQATDEKPADLTPQTPSLHQGSKHNQTPPYTATTTPAVSESEALARDIKEGILSGFVGNGTVLVGDTDFKGMLRVEGHISGSINSEEGTLIVSTNGLIDADIDVAIARIYGTVNGDIIASQRIEMGRVAKVTGDIHTPVLVIEDGAAYEGTCRMTGQPSSKQAARKKMRELGRNSSAAGSK